jgi:L-lactate dehydrogenase (cytochrome)
MPSIWTLDDLQTKAKSYLPACVFAWAAGGSERFIPGRTNQEAFEDYAFQTRILVDCSQTKISTKVFGKTYDAPFGIAPMGGAPVVGRQADLKMANGAMRGNIPFLISAGAGTRYEDAVAAAPNTWPQFGYPASEEVADRLIGRIIDSGAEVMVVTVDNTVLASSVHSQRLGWSLPIKMTPQLLLDGFFHPAWVWKVALPSFGPNGPRLENIHTQAHPKMFSFEKRPDARSYSVTWSDLERVRKLWPGKLVVKGIVNPADAERAVNLGSDAIMVSNHGGRQVDYAQASLRALPGVLNAARDVPVFIDSGFRHATHIMMALALGARFVFIGRPFLFAVAIGGEDGVVQAINILKAEMHRNLALIGCPDVNQLDRDFLVPGRVPSS